MEFVLNDGGRAAAGYKGDAGDCVVRAIAIATGTPYQEVYDDLERMNTTHMRERRDRVARVLEKRGSTPRNGNFRAVYELYLATKGFVWHPTMKIGAGCKVHLRADELPAGTIIARVSKHICAVIDGVIHDTHNPSRGGTRCVYGYYAKAS